MITCALRPYTPDDIFSFVELFGDADVMRYVGDGRPLSRAEASALFERIFDIYKTDPSFYIWAIDCEDGYAGHAELKRRAGRTEYELIYVMQRKRWGRGLGGCVVDRLLGEARAKRIPFVIATVDAENAASIAILRRRGFVRDDGISAALKTSAYRRQIEGGP